MRREIAVGDIANATLAGGVAIGSTADKIPAPQAFVIGVLAGVLATVGFALLQSRFQNAVKKIDTSGVFYLHGLPGLFGGLAAIFLVNGISGFDQIKGILVTIVVAMVAGFIVGKIVSLTGRRTVPYVDSEEFAFE